MVASAKGPDASSDSGNESGNEGWDVRESENLALEFLRGDMRFVQVRRIERSILLALKGNTISCFHVATLARAWM
jgi:hypothetical protein